MCMYIINHNRNISISLISFISSFTISCISKLHSIWGFFDLVPDPLYVDNELKIDDVRP